MFLTSAVLYCLVSAEILVDLIICNLKYILCGHPLWQREFSGLGGKVEILLKIDGEKYTKVGKNL